MRLTVTVSPAAARSLRGLAPPTDESRALLACAGRVGVALAPQHPRVTDGPLAGFFVAALAPGASSAAALSALRAEPAVDGAWLTPAEELP